MVLVKALSVFCIYLYVRQSVHGEVVGHDFLMPENMHNFEKQSTQEDFGRDLRSLSREIQIIDSNEESDENSVEMPFVANENAIRRSANEKLNQLLDNEIIGHNLGSLHTDFAEILKHPTSGNIITEVAARIETLMTNEECQRNVQSLIAQVRFYLQNENAPSNIHNTVESFVQFITSPDTVPMADKKCQQVVELIRYLGSKTEVFQEMKEIAAGLLGEKKLKRKIDDLFVGAHLMAEIDPSKTIRGLIAKSPAIAVKKLKSILIS